MNKLILRSIETLNYKSIQSDEYPLMINHLNDCFTSLPPFIYDTYNCQGRDDYFFIYVTDGIFNTEIDGKSYSLGKGSVVIYPPKYKYHYWGEPPSKYLSIHFTGSHAKKLLDDLGFLTMPYIYEGEFSQKVASLIEKMLEQDMIKAPFLQYSLSCLFEQVLLTVAIEKIRYEGYRSFKKSIKYINEFYMQKIQIPSLAKMEGLSNSRYITLFTKEMGKTPSDYITSLRISKACDYLSSSEMQIGEIGVAVGYKDQYFFSKIFKQNMGVSPSEYRKKSHQT